MLRMKQKKLDMTYIYYDKKKKKKKVSINDKDKKHKSETIKDVEEAINYRDTMVDMIRDNKLNIGIDSTVGDWVPVWLENYCTELRVKTRQDYAYHLGKYCQELYGLRLVGGIKAKDITVILKKMKDDGVAYSTIKRMRAILSSLFHRLRSAQIIAYDCLPTDGVIMPKCDEHADDKNKRRAFPREDLIRLADVAGQYSNMDGTKLRYGCAVRILVQTGMRLSELLGLCKGDVINIEEDTVTLKLNQSVHDVDKSASTYNLPWAVEALKNNKSYREIPINDKITVDLIKKLIDQQHPKANYADREYDFLFATRTGKPILKSDFSRGFSKIRQKAKLDIKPHEIRHSVATILAKIAGTNDAAIADAADFLGHSIQTFFKFYVHSEDQGKRNIAIALSLTDKEKAETVTGADKENVEGNTITTNVVKELTEQIYSI